MAGVWSLSESAEATDFFEDAVLPFGPGDSKTLRTANSSLLLLVVRPGAPRP